MQRKPCFPVANCTIKMPDCIPITDSNVCEEDSEQQQKRQQLINFGHTQWGFNNWSWSVTKQDLDFVDFTNGKYCAGVAAFVSITVKSFDIHRENVGYATSTAPNKGMAIYKSRKCAVTNALKETLLSFGGSVATELNEVLESSRSELKNPVQETAEKSHSPQRPTEPKNSPLNRNRNDSEGTNVVKNAPIAKAHPMPVNLPANRPPLAANAPRPPAGPPIGAPPLAPPVRPNSNVSFVLQPVMGGVVPPMYPPPRLPPPVPPQHMFPNAYYEYSGPWHFAYEYERSNNVNLNFNIPPKNLMVNGRGPECKNACRGAEGEPLQYGPPVPNQGCWIKPTIFYDGFWTEQKVKKWVAEQVEKQFPEDASHKSSSPSNPSDTNSKS